MEKVMKNEVSRGRGRPPIVVDGIKRKLSITLPKSEWERIDIFISTGNFTGMSEYFRKLHLEHFVWEKLDFKIPLFVKGV